ncbi:hypothetical protein [Lentzea sp. HUAS12]|nr:hypothetical protein [Lentzea sp. HUAS12]
MLDGAIADLGVPTLVSALRDNKNSVITWDPVATATDLGLIRR